MRELLVRVLVEQLPARYDEALGQTPESTSVPTGGRIRGVARQLARRLATEANATTYEAILREAISSALLEITRWSYDAYHAALWTIDLFASALSLGASCSASEQQMWHVVATAYRHLSEYDLCAADVTFFVDKTGLDVADVSVALGAAVSTGLLGRGCLEPGAPDFYYPAICDPLAA